MSTKTYHLRTRVDTGLASQPQVGTASSSPRCTDTAWNRDVPPHLPSIRSETGSTTALYSDVVASRPPLPVRETSSVTVTPDVAGPENVKISKQSKTNERVVSSTKLKENEFHFTSSDENDLPQDPEDEQWTTIER